MSPAALMRAPTVLLLGVVASAGCSRPATESGGSKPDTGSTDSARDTGDTDSAGDSDTSADTDTGTGDSGDTSDSVRPPEEPDSGIDIDSVASAKLIGEEEDGADGARGNVSVADAGDVDGDGAEDVVVGFQGVGITSDPPYPTGAAYLVRGPLVASLSLADVDARILGTYYSWAGIAVGGGGDVDGDGNDDIVVGADGYASGAYEWSTEGAAFVFRGPVLGDLSLDDADARLLGTVSRDSSADPAYSLTGKFVASAGDEDGDGYADVLVAAPGDWSIPQFYLARGPLVGDVELASSAWFGIVVSDATATGVANVGDTDGDGLPDMALAVAGYTGETGGYIFDGGVAEGVQAVDADAQLVSASIGCCDAVVAGGDVDGDGYADVVVALTTEEWTGHLQHAYVLPGPVTGELDFTTAAGHVEGEWDWSSLAAFAPSTAGDLDGDGRDDLVLGEQAMTDAVSSYSNSEGGAYVLLGPFEGVRSVADADVAILGHGNELVGQSAAGGRDLDGDGVPDFLLGAPGDDDGGEDAGAAWVVSGARLGSRCDATLPASGRAPLPEPRRRAQYRS